MADGKPDTADAAHQVLVLAFDLVPYEPSCQGTSATYKVSADISTLDAVKPGCSYRRFIAH